MPPVWYAGIRAQHHHMCQMARAHTLVCWLILQWGFFRGGATVFYALFGTIWAGHLGLLLFARTGLNRRLNNPAMTEPVMIWCILTLLASALYLDQGRLAVMRPGW